ncbi:LIC_13387 family protein [Arthrobacter celericrescens]|uniref:LIC_13387 family protein n=1 Tax=Arthrobacter celericrescens TaxID=2320851 RepID=UPI000EA3FB0C|nr:hypothetical protein [Arthrobacter celericrescens]
MQLTAFRVGAGAWMFTGVVHDILDLALPGDPELGAAMRASHVQLGPISLQAESLTQGISLAMGLAMFVVGLLLWMLARLLKATPDRMLPFGIVALAASIAALGLAALFIPGPPLVTFAIATAAFTIALIRKPSARPTAASRRQLVSRGA